MLGTFLPIVHAPLLGSLSAISRPDGVILFVIAVLGAIFALGNKVGIASVAGWVSLGLLIFEYAKMTDHINNPATGRPKLIVLGTGFHLVPDQTRNAIAVRAYHLRDEARIRRNNLAAVRRYQERNREKINAARRQKRAAIGNQ
jgi:hypothetical protein